MSDLLLINVNGPDSTGSLAAVCGLLADYEVDVLDIGQSVIHDHLSLGLLIDLPGQVDVGELQQALQQLAAQQALAVQFEAISSAQYQHWVTLQGRPRHIVTVLARVITAQHIQQIGRVAASHGLRIDTISRLSGRVSLDKRSQERSLNKSCVELSVRGGTADLAALRQEFMALSSSLDLDIAVQEDNLYRRNRRLVCFDMDSTLIETEVIDELARCAGVGEQVGAITEAAMRGELDFKESFRQRMALLKGLDEGVLADIAERLPVTEGAERLMATLRKLGLKTAILSGGFTYFGRHLQNKLGMDYMYANELEIVAGKVTGNVVGTVVDGQRKAALLQEIAASEGIALEQVIAVGDGANDLPMLGVAGLGIAFRAKPLVRESAEHAISQLGLDAILYLMGLRDRDDLL